MRVAMLGWEYPPNISGGLGTACEGLTRALAAVGVEIAFIVPHLDGAETAPHMHLSDADGPPPETGAPEAISMTTRPRCALRARPTRIPAALSPYWTAEEYRAWVEAHPSETALLSSLPEHSSLPLGGEPPEPQPTGHHYGRDLFDEVRRYAERVVAWTQGQAFDLVHAHDWMTFPAGIALSRALGIPLVLHVHSLEADRSGPAGDPRILAIEREGLRHADRIIAVSHYTAGLIQRLHGIALDRIDVVHNGVYALPTVSQYRQQSSYTGPVVLFLGRVTFQKGPEYFVEAAAKVVPQIPDVTFVMAGSGDLLPQMKEKVEELGLTSHFEFPGFVKGAEVERLYTLADAYVMPSVSEPFGLTALEAMSCDTPVILSRQSGAAEILKHALKVDFWDVDKLASDIIAVLTYPELRSDIAQMAQREVRKIHWNAAAEKVMNVYRTLERD